METPGKTRWKRPAHSVEPAAAVVGGAVRGARGGGDAVGVVGDRLARVIVVVVGELEVIVREPVLVGILTPVGVVLDAKVPAPRHN